jgi:dihydrolipoamide dehydrogenase
MGGALTENAYDVVIIGAGPGGYVAAIRAAQLGLRVALVEQERLGGVCLNWGCIPTKALLRNAEVLDLLRRGEEFGFTTTGLRADFGAAVERSHRASQRLVKGVNTLMKKNGVDVLRGRGTLRSPKEVGVALTKGGSRNLSAHNIIIATGARPRGLPGVLPDGKRVLTYRQAVALREVPDSVCIIGAGSIAMEFAHIWRTYGAEVTVVEALDRVLPLEDADVSAEIERAFRRRGVRLLTGTRVVATEPTPEGVCVTITGERQPLQVTRVLVVAGVTPNSDDLGLEQAGIRREEGFIAIDEAMRTTASHIYAIGDVTGKRMLAHVASAQGIVAAETIAGQNPRPLDYGAMPRCTYCQPQVASFGYTAKEAAVEGYAVRTSRFPFSASGKALAYGDRRGFVKIVIDGVSGEILGAHLVGPEVTELIQELVFARRMELTPDEIAHSVHAHPTLSEAVMEAAHEICGKALHI